MTKNEDQYGMIGDSERMKALLRLHADAFRAGAVGFGATTIILLVTLL